MDVIKNLYKSLQKEDGDKATEILGNFENYRQISLVRTNDIESLRIPDEIKNILTDFVKLNVSIGAVDILGCFENTNGLLRSFNRFAETKTSWVIKPMIKITNDLIEISKKCDIYLDENPEINKSLVMDSTIERESCLIKASRVIHNSFKLCLNDRNEDLSTSRIEHVYFFVCKEMEIFKFLNNKELGKNIEKVLQSKKAELPDLDLINKNDSIRYLYFSGIILLEDGDYKGAYLKFKHAYELCLPKSKQTEKILIYLIPLKFLITKKYIKSSKLRTYGTKIEAIYRDLVISLNNGDLKLFNDSFLRYEKLYLKFGLYFVIEKLEEFVLVKLIKIVYEFNDKSTQLNLQFVKRAIEFSKFHDPNNTDFFSMDETECLLSNLIYQGFIKGYISHSNGVLVLSKTNAFPLQVCD